jgi:hypothetical protein
MPIYILEAPTYSAFGHFCDTLVELSAESLGQARQIADKVGTVKSDCGAYSVNWSRASIKEKENCNA